MSILNRVSWWCVLIVVSLTVLFFIRIFFFDEQIAFRDGAHFYPMLFEHIQTAWLAGRVPLWNPYENLGQPLLANPVSSVFYPGKLVYFLPVPVDVSYHIYVIGHVLLAALTCYRLARHWNVSVYASGMAAVSYAFGGNVLFQYSNVVFLVGAAWLPEAILHADRILTKRSFSAVLALGVTLSLLILGGDPQMIYHVLIAILLLAFFYRRNERNVVADREAGLSVEATSVLQLLENGSIPSGLHETSNTRQKTFWTNPFLLLFFAFAVCAALAAVQWIPSLEYGLATDRMLEEKPSSVWGGIRVLERGYREHDHKVWHEVRDGFLCRDQHEGGISEVRYQNSVGPWQLPEFLWPNAYGRLFPTNTYWGAGIPWSENHFWVPSLYMGILPFLLAVVSIRFRKSDPVTLWSSWTCLLFLLGSFGYFGLGWVVRQCLVLFGSAPEILKVGDPFGGVYWLFNLILPGYQQFRFPAKLMVVASLMFSLLAARGFDFIFAAPNQDDPIYRVNHKHAQKKRKKRLLFVGRLHAIVSFALIPLVLIPQCWIWLGKHIGVHPVFGEFLPDRALGEAAFSLIHVINVLFAFFVAARIFSRATTSLESSVQIVSLKEQTFFHQKYFHRLGLALLIMVAFDVLLSNSWMVATVKRSIFKERIMLATMIGHHDKQGRTSSEYLDVNDKKDASFPPPRFWRAPAFALHQHPWFPPEFAAPSNNRLAEWVAWERTTLAPHYPMTESIALSDVRGTVVFADYYAVTHILRSLWSGRNNDPQNNPLQNGESLLLPLFLESLGVSAMVIPREQSALSELSPWEENDVFAAYSAYLLPPETDFRPLEAVPYATIADRIEIETPLVFRSRRAFFEKTFSILERFQQTGVPVVEWGSERFENLPPRFARAFAMLVARGEHDKPLSSRQLSHQSSDRAEFVSYEPERVVIEVNLAHPGLLLLRDQYEANWRAEVRAIPESQYSQTSATLDAANPSQDVCFDGKIPKKEAKKGEITHQMIRWRDSAPPFQVPVFRTNRVMRGVPLPEGNWEVTLTYYPLSFRFGATLSFFAWAASGMFVLGTVVRKTGCRKKSRA
ncbi:MAG: YfhO family protein [Planctomycetaceae bacterium]|nr:YfhO family protein [Planctomycetaceae bacterium]